MMQTHMRVGDRPRFNDGEGSTGRIPLCGSPGEEGSSHRPTIACGRPGSAALRDELNSAHDAVREPHRKRRAPCSAEERVSKQNRGAYQKRRNHCQQRSAPDPSAQPSTRKTVECDTWWRKLPGPPSPKKVRGRFIHASRPHMAAPKLPHFCHPPSTGCRKERSQVYAVISR
jgi:hypothetical protein